MWGGGAYVPKKFEIVEPMPAGSIAASATDMAKFMIAHLNNGELNGQRILADSTAKRMHARAFGHDPRIPGFALGFYEKTSHGLRIIGHGGDTQWFHTDLALIPDEKVGVFVSYNTNTGGELSFAQFLTQFLDHYYPTAPSAVVMPADAAQAGAARSGRIRVQSPIVYHFSEGDRSRRQHSHQRRQRPPRHEFTARRFAAPAGWPAPLSRGARRRVGCVSGGQQRAHRARILRSGADDDDGARPVQPIGEAPLDSFSGSACSSSLERCWRRSGVSSAAGSARPAATMCCRVVGFSSPRRVLQIVFVIAVLAIAQRVRRRLAQWTAHVIESCSRAAGHRNDLRARRGVLRVPSVAARGGNARGAAPLQRRHVRRALVHLVALAVESAGLEDVGAAGRRERLHHLICRPEIRERASAR